MIVTNHPSEHPNWTPHNTPPVPSQGYQHSSPPPSAGLPVWQIVLAAVTGCVVVLFGIWAMTGGLTHGSDNSAPSPDAHLVSCSYDGAFVHLKYQVTNRDTVAHDY